MSIFTWCKVIILFMTQHCCVAHSDSSFLALQDTVTGEATPAGPSPVKEEDAAKEEEPKADGRRQTRMQKASKQVCSPQHSPCVLQLYPA